MGSPTRSGKRGACPNLAPGAPDPYCHAATARKPVRSRQEQRSDVTWSPSFAKVVASASVLVASTIGIAAASPAVDFVAVPEFATEREIEAVRSASTIANAVKASDCLHDFMARRALVETNGRTSREVADHLRGITGTVPVAFYYRCNIRSRVCPVPTSAVAYRQPPDPTIYINRAHFDVSLPSLDIYELAGTLDHESVGHSLGGYSHSFEWTPSRDFSVPYSISGASRANDDAFQRCRRPLGY